VKAGLVYASAADRGHVYAKLGRVEDAHRMLALLEARQEDQPEVTLDLDFAIVYEGLGDRDRALQHLHRAVDRRMGSVIMMNSFTSLQGMRHDPRFHAVLDRVGIPHAAPA
jgi:hypothetical protein